MTPPDPASPAWIAVLSSEAMRLAPIVLVCPIMGALTIDDVELL